MAMKRTNALCCAVPTRSHDSHHDPGPAPCARREPGRLGPTPFPTRIACSADRDHDASASARLGSACVTRLRPSAGHRISRWTGLGWARWGARDTPRGAGRARVREGYRDPESPIRAQFRGGARDAQRARLGGLGGFKFQCDSPEQPLGLSPACLSTSCRVVARRPAGPPADAMDAADSELRTRPQASRRQMHPGLHYTRPAALVRAGYARNCALPTLGYHSESPALEQ
jgi:hypothetical protein